MRATMSLALGLLRENPGWELTLWVDPLTEQVGARIVDSRGNTLVKVSHRLPYQAVVNAIRKVRST